jgi:hypothetical protein
VGEVNDCDVRSLIESGDVDDAVQRALTMRVRDVIEQLDYETLEEHPEDASAFLQQWVPALDPGERLQAATWASGQYVTAIVHVEGAYGIGARLLLEAQRASAAELAATMRDVAALTCGPDAELMPSVAQRLDGYADQLDAMDFSRW